MQALIFVVAALLGPSGARLPSADAVDGAPEPPAEREAKEEAAEESLPARDSRGRAREALAKYLDPARYPPAFFAGAQAELLDSVGAVSSAVFGYDLVWMQIDFSLGLTVGKDPVRAQDVSDVYVTGLRLAFPVHRGIKCDFGVVFGSGLAFIAPPTGGTDVIGSAAAGARFRIFQTPNVALTGTIGAGALISGDSSRLIVGARPLGAAAVVYYFR